MDSLAGSCWFSIQMLALSTSLLLGFQAVKDPSSSCTLNRTVGESVQLTLNSSPDPNIREIEWSWESPSQRKQLLVSWKPDGPGPDWYDIKDLKNRFNLTKLGFLIIKNLTVEMSGLYTAEIKFKSGQSQVEAFQLCVYEPIPHPQIQIHSISNTSDWCNVTLECDTPGYTEDLTVTWMANNLEQNRTLVPTPHSKNLSLSLPIDQWNVHLTCVVSNPADQKNATLDLRGICPQKGHPQSNWIWMVSILLAPLVGLGIVLWIYRWRKMKTDRAAARQALHTVDYANQQTGGADSLDTPYAEIGLLTQPKNDTEASNCRARRSELTPAVHTIYKELQISPKPRGDT
ncbi:SLAM family member 5-like isoform X2 [Ochotona curzoniae]|uniref:SLAM family member 5-like isoform X2 n=1 Tax=Ochotona curzoniae TaxID=130825 RepID=UPI001B350312|nr:SLAM family member 5-like isoform X2 [Ochotona curzoniae]